MFLLADIGGTKMRVGFSADERTIADVVTEPTPKEPAVAIARIGELARQAGPLDGACLGVTGVLDERKNALVFSAHLPGWVGAPLAEPLSSALGLSPVLENDTALVALGEARFGAGRAAPADGRSAWPQPLIMAYVTVSTGIGAARLVDGRIDERRFGFEVGHQILDWRAGTSWESLASGSALADRFGRPPKELTDEALWADEARQVAAGLYNLILHWSPDLVVLGGSMITGTPGVTVEAVRVELEHLPRVFPIWPELRRAELADQGGLYGALAFLTHKTPPVS